jgi:Proteasome subunit
LLVVAIIDHRSLLSFLSPVFVTSQPPTMNKAAESGYVLHANTEGSTLAQFSDASLAGPNQAATTTAATIEHRGFSPYDFNGGTVAAVAGLDYCVIAADTRLSSGYEILSRNVTKVHPLTDQAFLASSGCKTDVDQLRSWMGIQLKVLLYTTILYKVLLDRWI